MEKRIAHYPLTELQTQIQRIGQQAFTRTAVRGGLDMGLDIADMLAVIAGLTHSDLYKSMTTYNDHTIWQDVYHATVSAGGKTKTAYIKLTMRDNVPVVQFKEK